MSEFDVFLSHNSTDKPVVRALATALQARDLKVWLDEWELIPGRPWQEALEKIIETTKSAAILVGKDGMGPWERPEMRACLSEFAKRSLPVIPVLLPGAGHEPKLPLFLAEFKWVDLREGLTDDKIDQLIWAITGVRPGHIAHPPGGNGGAGQTGINRRTLLIRGTVSVLAAAICWVSISVFLNRPDSPITEILPLSGSTWSFAQAGAFAGTEIAHPAVSKQLSDEFETMLQSNKEGYVFFSQPLTVSVMNPTVDVDGLNHVPLSDVHASSFAFSGTSDRLEEIAVELRTADDQCRASLTGIIRAETRIVLLFYVAGVHWSAVDPPDLQLQLVQWDRVD